MREIGIYRQLPSEGDFQDDNKARSNEQSHNHAIDIERPDRPLSAGCLNQIRAPHPKVVGRHHEPLNGKASMVKPKLHLKVKDISYDGRDSAENERQNKQCSQRNLAPLQNSIG